MGAFLFLKPAADPPERKGRAGEPFGSKPFLFPDRHCEPWFGWVKQSNVLRLPDVMICPSLLYYTKVTASKLKRRWK